MPMIPTQVIVQCPRDSKAVDVREACQLPSLKCLHFEHFSYRETRVYVVCSFGKAARREECVLQEPANKELDEMEEEVVEAE